MDKWFYNPYLIIFSQSGPSALVDWIGCVATSFFLAKVAHLLIANTISQTWWVY